ncbi:hypothetical protein KL925_000770 [Ogataea polymorpha]|nr:hypothetical protein KL925_000770 [Ogataea polymorpha]
MSAPVHDTRSVFEWKLDPTVIIEKTRSIPNNVIEAKTADLYLRNHGDWRDELVRDGFAVVKGVISKDKVYEYQLEAFEWMKSFGNDKLDFHNPSTWKTENLPPVRVDINTYFCFCVNHERFMWKARMEPGVMGAFEKLWGTDKLLVSFEGLNVTFPGRTDVPKNLPWPHFDQSPFKRGIHCAQSFISLSNHGPNDGGLVAYRGSHKLFKEFFDTQVRKSDWDHFNYYQLSERQLNWFINHGCKEVKVNCEAGDLVIWDSRTCHWGKEPEETSQNIRTVLYTCFSPVEFATQETLAKKKELFENWKGTTHWPHTDLVSAVNPQLTTYERKEPLKKPIKTEKLLKLAGALEY